MSKSTYHHGNLRNALVEEGLALIADRDVGALSLRYLASRLGVTATSVYRHFQNKQALLSALAEEGLARLAQAQQAAGDAAGGGGHGFAATGRAYVRFAIANPALFRLIFSLTQRARDTDAGETGGKPEIASMLAANAAASVADKPNAPAAPVRAVQAWALVHGLALLILDGHIPADDAIIDAALTRDAFG